MGSPGVVVGALAMLSLAGCAEGDSGARPGRPSPALVLVDSVVLSETDSVLIGQVGAFAAPEDGSYLLADQSNRSIRQFRGDGTHLRTIGRPGTGPGEFRTPPSAISVDADSVLYVFNSPGRLQKFDYRSGGVTSEQRLGALFLRSMASSSGRLVFHSVDSERRATVALLDSNSDSVLYGGPFPSPLGRSPVLDKIVSAVQIATFGQDSMAVAIQSSDFIFAGPILGPEYDSSRVAVLNRQGSRPDILEKVATDPAAVGEEVYTPSLPTALARLSSGMIAYVTSDMQLRDRRFLGTMYLSIVDLAGDRSCPDAKIPAPADPRPFAAFRGDTLLVLHQDVEEVTSPKTIVRKYLVSADECRWISGRKHREPDGG